MYENEADEVMPLDILTSRSNAYVYMYKPAPLLGIIARGLSPHFRQ